MKILVIQDTDWIKRNPGQQHHLAERLLLRGHELRVIDYEILWQTEGKKELYSRRQVYPNISKIFRDAGITVIRPGISKIPVLNYASMIFTYNYEINKQIKEFKPDVIVSHSILTNYLALRLSKKNNIPFVFHMTDAQHTIIPHGFLQPVGRIIESRILRNADRVVTINDKLRDYAVGLGANPDKTYVVKAGIDLERYDPNIYNGEVRERYGIAGDDKVLFFMGWLYHFSGLKEVVIELSKIKNEKIKFLIVGDGDAFNDLSRIREEYNLGNQVILTGKQPYETIPQFIAASDVCLLPAYLNETMRDIVPIKLYEYMAMGKPVIATKLPGVVKEFGYGNGVVYSKTPEEVVSMAIDLAENEKINNLGIKARNFVEKNDWDNVTDEFENILEDIVCTLHKPQISIN